MFSIRSTPPKSPTLTTPSPFLSEPATTERTARHLRQCQLMAELGMELVEAAASRARQSLAADAPKPADEAAKSPDPALLFAHLTRSVRQAITLECRIVADLQRTERARRDTPQANRRISLHRAFNQLADIHPSGKAAHQQALDRADQDVAADPDGIFTIGDHFLTICRDLHINLEETGLPPEMEMMLPRPARPKQPSRFLDLKIEEDDDEDEDEDDDDLTPSWIIQNAKIPDG